MCKRLLEKEIKQRKVAMIAALWANGNLGGDDLNNAVDEIETNYDRAISFIWGAVPEEEPDIDWEDPFFAAAKRGMDNLDTLGTEGAVPPEATVEHMLPPEALEASD